LCLDKNPLLQEIQLSGCSNAITDSIVTQIATKFPHLYFLDISFADKLTDAGLKAFEGKKLGIEYLTINGVGNISSEALTWVIDSVSDCVRELEIAMLMQPQMQSHFANSLGRCYQLEFLDMSGDSNVDDTLLMQMQRNMIQKEDENENRPFYRGLQHLHTAKIGGIQISNMNLSNLVKIAPNIEHLELTKCTNLSDIGVIELLRVQGKTLKFLDINYIPDLKWPFFDELRNNYPDLLIRRFANYETDKKDTGLRVPRRLIEKKKKKGKKKGGGGKKKK